MILKEQNKDFFSVDFDVYTPVHCISRDCKMGAGIAVPIKKKFKLYDLKDKIDSLSVPISIGTAVYHNGVYNLITKSKYYDKPTYDTLTKSLVSMLIHIKQNKITKIVMPKIGCGLDRLQWSSVREIIGDVFKHVDDLEIIACYK